MAMNEIEVDSLQDPRNPVAPAGTPDSRCIGIGERCHQFIRAGRVIPSQIPARTVDVAVRLWAKSALPQSFERALHALAIYGTSGGNDADDVTAL
jgi:hypothetical protein